MRHFVPLKSVPYFAAASSHCFISISQTLRFPGISDSPDSMRHFIPLESVPYLTGSILLTPPQGKKSTLLRCALFCFTRYRPEKLFQKCIVADRMYVRPGFSMTMPSAHTVVAVDQYFLSNRLYALKEKVVGIFANSVSYVAPRSNLVHEDTFTLFPVSA